MAIFRGHADEHQIILCPFPPTPVRPEGKAEHAGGYADHEIDLPDGPIEVDVAAFNMGDVIDIFPYDGRIEKDGAKVIDFKLKSDVLFDEVRAGGRINLIIGRSLTAKAREFLKLPVSTAFRLPQSPAASNKPCFCKITPRLACAVGCPGANSITFS